MIDLRKTPVVLEVRPTAPPRVPLFPSGAISVVPVPAQAISIVPGRVHAGVSPPIPLPQ